MSPTSSSSLAIIIATALEIASSLENINHELSLPFTSVGLHPSHNHTDKSEVSLIERKISLFREAVHAQCAFGTRKFPLLTLLRQKVPSY